MKRLPVALLAIFLFFAPRSTYAQNNDDMKAMAAYAAPGDIHKMLAKSAGTWTCAVTMWMAPGAQPMNSTTEAKNEMILGGRYLQQTNTGSFMGQPFTGVSTTAYDNAKKIFINTWIDNMGTGIMVLTGTWDAASNTVTFTGNEVDPVSGKDIPVKETLKIVDDNHEELAMYSTAGGKEFKNMEIKMVRKS
jgi:hypothetical protein